MADIGIIYAYEDLVYQIGKDYFRQVFAPTPTCISVAIIEPIKVYPEDDTGVKVNDLGHLEGKVELVEKYQTDKTTNIIEASKNLGYLLQKNKHTLFFEKINAPSDLNRQPRRDLLVCSKIALSNLIDKNYADQNDYYVFEMYEEDSYIAKSVIENWPFMLLLQASYRELVDYLKEIGLYENRWPFTHTWQNDSVEFAQMAPIIATPVFTIWSLGYFHSLNGLYVRDELMPRFLGDDHVLIVDWGLVFPASALLISKCRYPENIYWCANGQAELDSLKSMGVNAHLVSHNVFVNHRVFDIQDQPKKFDAIFNNTLIPFKRPGLAKKVQNVVYTSGSEPEKEYKKMINRQKNATVKINSSPFEISELINQSRCGLVLSQAEGGNYATTEYLLCGIPVVTTKNIGGRDTYLDSTNSIFCEKEDPKSIAKCVKYIVDNPDKFDPVKIRQDTLNRNYNMLVTLCENILMPILKRYVENFEEVAEKLIVFSLSLPNPNSKGRTTFQPEYALIFIE